MTRAVLLVCFAALAARAFQPDLGPIRKLFEESLAKKQREFGDGDARTAQAARDLGNFLLTVPDRSAARRALADAVRVDEKAFGPGAAQTLEDAAALASLSPAVEAQALWRRAAESPDPTVAGPALTSLAASRKAAGDRGGAAALLRRALEKAEAADGKEGLTVALILDQLSLVVDAREAIALVERAVAIEQKQFGPQDPRTVQDARRLAALKGGR